LILIYTFLMNLLFRNNIVKNILFIFPLFILLSFIFIFSVDVPWFDDVMIIAFVRNLEINGWDFRILQQLFTNYNEHILVVTKLLFWLNQKIFGYINLSFLSLQGLLFYISFII